MTIELNNALIDLYAQFAKKAYEISLDNSNDNLTLTINNQTYTYITATQNATSSGFQAGRLGFNPKKLKRQRKMRGFVRLYEYKTATG